MKNSLTSHSNYVERWQESWTCCGVGPSCPWWHFTNVIVFTRLFSFYWNFARICVNSISSTHAALKINKMHFKVFRFVEWRISILSIHINPKNTSTSTIFIVNNWWGQPWSDKTRGPDCAIIRTRVLDQVLAVHVLEVDLLHEDVSAVLAAAGDVLHVVRVVNCEVPLAVPPHLTVAHQRVLCNTCFESIYLICR